ncbi:hypothetical protein P6166_04465 [Stenotrophomonas sp. HITSZ_GD]|uniref:hypothetical protein n=1 Tax=Stenotrophomonas sp. HITSZ_GD TaxID=3037248 RepID=UPI00240E7863|nr:hypothetical protein [Stenotrophomonas sp. HITSZ_GD]MDG2524610.1 hypothetical protein [Stenotrophomonas sp. HITSZ_GD]
MSRTCTSCCRRLPSDHFPPAERRRSTCRLCEADEQRVRARLAPVRIDPLQVRLNNAAEIWHGPVDRGTPLRCAA